MTRRFRQSVEQMRTFADNATKRATDADDKAHDILDRIPMGQPIIQGHHSQRRHEHDLDRAHTSQDKAIAATDRAEYWTRKANHAEQWEALVDGLLAHNPEGVEIGDEVTAKFTNSGIYLSFPGVIVGRTKNDWKVKALTSPWPNEEPGRVYKIAASGSRTHSVNNCVVKA